VNTDIACIGGGYWGKNLIRNFSELGVLRTVCEVDASTRGRLSQQYPSVMFTDSLNEIIADPDINGVAVATPAETHADIVRECLLADKDVLVEKPLCLSSPEGSQLVELAKERDRILMVGHLLWYHPAVLQLKQLVDRGELGRIQYIYSNRLNLGKIRREENILWSFAPHDISVIIGLLRDMPAEVTAQGGNYLHAQIADVTVSLLSFANGVRAHVFVSWLHPCKEQKLVVVGDAKMAVFDDVAPWPEKLLLYPHRIDWKDTLPIASKADAEPVPLVEQEPLRAECAHFVECMATRALPRTDAREGLRVLKVLEMCQHALKTRERVSAGFLLKPEAPSYFAHETAVIDDGVEIGAGTKIWHFSHVLRRSNIGKNCTLGQNVVVGPNVTIGSNCKIQNNVSVYDGVTLEDGVFCGPSMVFTNVINPRAHIDRKSEFQSTLVKRGATIGANATVICGHTLGRYCLIGAGGVVTKDVPDYALMIGTPTRQAGWVCQCAARLELVADRAVCASCGDRYMLVDGLLRPEQDPYSVSDTDPQ